MVLKSLLGDKFKSDNITDEEKLNEKITCLGLSSQDINRIKQLTFQKPTGDYSHLNESKQNPQIIDVNDIKGTLRFASDANDWYEYMDKYVQKLNTYKSYSKNKDSFNDMLTDINHSGLPTLTKIGNYYYIKESGDGNHRVTIAKCIGAQKIAAIIYE
ncbi:Uncharacterised protein [[Clostridium] sordellii]|uniref:hypothetical protein n=1 Tax=Paraclostridium sordellii TaxID=1505 RepID=UPI0005E8B1B2|nr:hypothetical protein [Paeniclostridium sordellii]CEO36556.1 Uncharacterised protein [[Clostridium] sordellii] [Paeniclostridium sordellii]